jgi:hypothetical protein
VGTATRPRRGPDRLSNRKPGSEPPVRLKLYRHLPYSASFGELLCRRVFGHERIPLCEKCPGFPNPEQPGATAGVKPANGRLKWASFKDKLVEETKQVVAAIAGGRQIGQEGREQFKNRESEPKPLLQEEGSPQGRPCLRSAAFFLGALVRVSRIRR